MMLPDVNLLVYAVDETAGFHRTVATAYLTTRPIARPA